MPDVTDEKSAIIKAALGTAANIYYIGPFGSRVSFASQQRRILNLIWALRERKAFPLKRGRVKVAVIGAGFAGVMAVAALHALDYDVVLYEQRGHALNLQETSSHRHVHPTINFWPDEDLLWTTRLPFFDWYAGSSAEIIKVVSDRWTKEVLKTCTPKFNTVVQNVSYDQAAQQVVIKHAGGSDTADVAFIATGFGKEDDLGDSNQNSYWRIDDANLLVTSNTTLLVSGIGDGGLIDALRLVYRRFMEDEVALRYLLAIDTPGMMDAAREIETGAALLKDKSKRAEFLEEQYRTLAKSRPPFAKDQLKAPHEGKPKVALLVGNNINPFLGSAAPIHKLILAHTLNEDWIECREGRLLRDKRSNNYYILKGRSRTKVREQVVIVRHGPEAPLARIVGAEEAQFVRKAQLEYGNFLHVLGMAPEYFNNQPSVRSFGRNSKFLAVDRHALAAEIMLKRFGAVVEANFEYYSGEARYHAAPIDGTYNDGFGAPPAELFNVQVVHGTRLHRRLNPKIAAHEG